ncbi:HAD-IA family hydrolase [Salinadaptatus halalkaliphilus]|uniref:HAD-IA family hydrolase n=1 Tax=Salinadaptatus halalkaliphilus TaxID=2419781 RepID=UPI001FE2E724|nr:HAD-IA family hydrolase [Salinadaptatus halalkaliphilus]
MARTIDRIHARRQPHRRLPAVLRDEPRRPPVRARRPRRIHLDETLAVNHEPDVFDDVRDGLEALRNAGYDCSVVSNGNPEMLESMVSHADIDDLVEATISADEVRTFKPDAELHRHAAARTGTPIDEVAHVTAGWFDVMGAQNAGIRGSGPIERGGRGNCSTANRH